MREVGGPAVFENKVSEEDICDEEVLGNKDMKATA